VSVTQTYSVHRYKYRFIDAWDIATKLIECSDQWEQNFCCLENHFRWEIPPGTFVVAHIIDFVAALVNRAWLSRALRPTALL